MRKLELTTLIKRARKRKGWNQEEMAFQMNMPQSTISKLENGFLEIRARDLFEWIRSTEAQDMLIAITLNVDMSMFVDVDMEVITDSIVDLLTNLTPALINLIGVIL